MGLSRTCRVVTGWILSRLRMTLGVGRALNISQSVLVSQAFPNCGTTTTERSRCQCLYACRAGSEAVRTRHATRCVGSTRPPTRGGRPSVLSVSHPCRGVLSLSLIPVAVCCLCLIPVELCCLCLSSLLRCVVSDSVSVLCCFCLCRSSLSGCLLSLSGGVAVRSVQVGWCSCT